MKSYLTKLSMIALSVLKLLTLTDCGAEGNYKKVQELLAKGEFVQAVEKFDTIGKFRTLLCTACTAKRAYCVNAEITKLAWRHFRN